MQRISSSWTFFSKWVVPVVFLAMVSFVFFDFARSGAFADDPFFLIGPVFMLGFGFFMFKRFVFDLADAVVDHGAFLSVRRGSVEDKIYLENIMNVSATPYMNPPRITLRLISSSKFGKEVSFSPKATFSLNPFAKSKIADDLIERAYAARVRSAA